MKDRTSQTKPLERPAIGEDVLRLLEAALDSVPGYLPDVADHAGLTVPEAIKIGDLLVRRGLFLAFDDEPWAPTIEGYRLIQRRRQGTSIANRLCDSAERSPRITNVASGSRSESANRG